MGVWISCRSIAALGLALLLGGLASGGRAGAERHAAVDRPAPWTQLSFHATSTFGTATAEVERTRTAALEASEALVPSPEGGDLQPEGEEISLLRVRTSVEPWLGSPQRIESRVWFGAPDASALQRVRTRSGGEPYHKLYRFTRSGVYRSKTVPRRSEEGSSFERWTRKSERFYAYPPSAPSCKSISEPSVLLDLISTRPPAPGDAPRELCLFNKKQLHRVRLVTTGLERLRVDYTDLSQSATPRRREVDAVRVSLVATPLHPAEREPEAFTFLELRGDIVILVDRDARVPLRVRGSVPIFGSLDFVLREVIRSR